MAAKKKLKIKIPDSALRDIPEDEREGVEKQIREMFDGDQDPRELGQPVEQLEPGAKNCPKCGSLLEPGPTFPVPNTDGGQMVVQIFDCPECDLGFMGEPLN